MSNKIVQLENEDGDNLYPLAGGALTGSISKTMLEEGVFEGPELTEPNTVAYVAEGNIQDDAVTTSKIADGSVTSDKIDWTTLLLPTEQIACSVKVNGTDSPKALTKFSLGNGYSIVMGQFLGQASSVTAETVVPIQVNTSSQLFSAVYGYSINLSQSSQAGSGTRYALAQPNTKLIDAYCYAPGTQTGFSVGFIVFGKDA